MSDFEPKKKNSEKSHIPPFIGKFFSKSPIPMAIFNLDGILVKANTSYLRFYGHNRKELIGKKVSELGHLSTKEWLNISNEIKKKRCVENIILKVKTKNNEVRQIVLSIMPTVIDKERLFLSVAFDISDAIMNAKKKKDEIFKIFMSQKPDSAYIEKQIERLDFTPRQKEVAFLVAIGHSNKDIAEKLCVSEYTVKDHLKEIFQKVEVHSRCELFPKLINLR